MKKKLFTAAAILAGLLLISCKTPEKQAVKQPGEVSTIYNGKAVITQIRDLAGRPGADDRDYVEIYFNFVLLKAKGEASSDTGSSETMIKLFYDNRETFHKSWVKKWDIKNGKEYPAIRRVTRKENKLQYITYEVFIEPDRKQ